MGRRRQRYGSIASTLSESEGSVIASVDVATSTVSDQEEADADTVDSISKRVGAEVIINQGEPKAKCEKSKGQNSIVLYTFKITNTDYA